MIVRARVRLISFPEILFHGEGTTSCEPFRSFQVGVTVRIRLYVLLKISRLGQHINSTNSVSVAGRQLGLKGEGPIGQVWSTCGGQFCSLISTTQLYSMQLNGSVTTENQHNRYYYASRVVDR